MKKYLILFSFLLLNVLLVNGQDCYKPCLYRGSIDSTKIKIYKSILLSEEVKDENKVQLISIRTIDLEIIPNRVLFLDTITEQRDSLSVPKLKKIFPYYYFYEEESYEKYRKYTEQKEIMYHDYQYNTGGWGVKDYTYIRIFEPLDRWANLYLWLSYLENGAPYEIIPVLYTRIKNNEEIKRKYMFYKVTFSKEGKIETVNVVN